MSNKKKELLKNTIIIFIGKISTQFLTFLLLPIYTRFLSTDDYGYVDLIITYISLLIPIITIQQEMASFRFLVDSRNNEKRIKSVISTSFRNVFRFLLLFIVLYLIVRNFVSIKYEIYIILNVSVCIFSNLLLQISRGLGKNTNYSIGCFLSGLITLISNIILICFIGIGSNGILLSMIIANVICFIYLFLSLKLYNYISYKYIDQKLSSEMLKYSLPLVPNGISWWFINVSDRTIISLFLGVSSNGIYAIANKFPSIISSLLSIFSLSWSESASLHINDEDKDTFFSSVADTVLRVFSCACILLIVLLPLVFNFIIGNDYIEAYNYIPIFLIGTLASCIVNIYSAIYIAKKLTKKVASTSIVAAILNIVINLIFIKYIGLYAAALSTALSYLIMMIYRGIDVKKYVKIKYNPNLIITTIIMFILCMISYYLNILLINIIIFVICLVYSFIINKTFLLSIYNNIKNLKKNIV